MQKIRQCISLLFAALSLLLVASPVTYAATSSAATGSGNGYRITPVRTDLTLNKGTTKDVTVYIKNISSKTEELQVLINDFTSDNELGSPALLLNSKNAPEHGLKQYITAPRDTISLQPNQQKAVNIRIAIPDDAKAGGYFGAVRFAPAGIPNAERVNVNLAASVASLILVTVPGNYSEQLSVASFDIAQDGNQHSFFTTSKNLQAIVRFQNSGDVQEQPFGKVLVSKDGKTVYSAEINDTDPRGNVLPDSIRKFSVDLKKIGSFGKYTVEGNFGYGSKGQLLSAKTTFYVIPLAAIIAVILLLLVIVLAVFVLPRMVRSHDRRVLRRSGRR